MGAGRGQGVGTAQCPAPHPASAPPSAKSVGPDAAAWVKSPPPARCSAGSIVNACHQLFKGREPSFLKKAAAAAEERAQVSYLVCRCPREKRAGGCPTLGHDGQGQRPGNWQAWEGFLGSWLSPSPPGLSPVLILTTPCQAGPLDREGGGRGPGGGHTTEDPFSLLSLATLPWGQESGGDEVRAALWSWRLVPLCLGVLRACGRAEVLLESASSRWGHAGQACPTPHSLSRLRTPCGGYT